MRSQCPTESVLMAWLGQIRFPVPKRLTGTVNCSCFCEWSWSLVCCNLSRVLNVSLQLSIEMIAMIVQKREVKDWGIWWQSNNPRMMKIWTSSFPWVGQDVAWRLEAWIYKWTMIRPYITEPWPQSLQQVSGSFPIFVLTSSSGPTRKSQICSWNQSHKILHF